MQCRVTNNALVSSEATTLKPTENNRAKIYIELLRLEKLYRRICSMEKVVRNKPLLKKEERPSTVFPVYFTNDLNASRLQ